MSAPVYLSLGLAVVFVAIAYASRPETHFLLTVLPMLFLLAVLPAVLGKMNRGYAANVAMDNFKLYRVKDLTRLETGAAVRIRGTVETVSLKWLNRPHFQVNDGSGVVSVLVFIAPRESIAPGDKIEAVGSLRAFGLSKKRRVWGLKVVKVT